MEYLFVVGRLVYAAFFISAGIDHLRHRHMMTPYAAAKGVPAAPAMVVLTGVQLLAGGFSVAFGLWPVVGLTLIAAFLLPTSIIMHNYWAAEPNAKMMERVQFRKNIALLGATLTMMAIPQPWVLSLGTW